MDEKEVILGQYKVYSQAKENFIERHFATNRFYFVFSFALLTAEYVFYALSYAFVPILATAVFGIAVSILWWLNIDSYQVLIKIKYAKVLEYLETKLPECPYTTEFKETRKLNKVKTLTFPDVQKGFAAILLVSFLVIFVYSCMRMLNLKGGSLL